MGNWSSIWWVLQGVETCCSEKKEATVAMPSLLFCRGMSGLFGFGFGHEVDEVLLPDGSYGVGAVAAGGVGDGDEDEFCLGHPWKDAIVEDLFA